MFGGGEFLEKGSKCFRRRLVIGALQMGLGEPVAILIREWAGQWGVRSQQPNCYHEFFLFERRSRLLENGFREVC